MANSLNRELEGKTVVFKKGALKEEFANMPFKVTGGFGANAFTSGRALFGMFIDGEEARMSGYDVAKIVPDIPVLNRMVELKKQANDEFTMPPNGTTLGAMDEWVTNFWLALLVDEGIAIDGNINEAW